MVSGFERYYQIARCFRDEDLRADRQPEFTQLDIEMSFVEESDIIAAMEEMVRSVFADVLSVTLPDPLPRLTYAEAMQRFGTDRPDLRIPLEPSTQKNLAIAGLRFTFTNNQACRPLRHPDCRNHLRRSQMALSPCSQIFGEIPQGILYLPAFCE